MSTRNDGYFPQGSSVLRQVQEERAVGLFYGQRALGLGALAPVNFIGTRNHTRLMDQPFKRLVRTAKMFETIFFGSKEDADRVLKIVHGMHQQVVGTLEEQVGPYAAGTPYSAFDPQMMLWTIGVMADSAVVFYELFVRRLSSDERDAFWQDYLRFGALFGMPTDDAPASWADFQRWLHGRLADDDHFLTAESRYVAHATMFSIPTSPSRRPGMALHNVIMRGTLPPVVREKYGLNWTPADELAFKALVASSKVSRVLAPARTLRGPCTRQFDDVAAAERAIVAAGRMPPGALAA